jgi:hypothetical protein
MKLFIFIFFLLTLLQTSFVPLNLCLILLICRSYASHQRSNYYLALAGGLYLGILSAANLGFWPIVMLMVVLLMHIIRLLPITARYLTVIPVTLVVVLAVSWIENFFLKTPLIWWYPVISAMIALPVYIVVREWEDRFVAKPGIKLRV